MKKLLSLSSALLLFVSCNQAPPASTEASASAPLAGISVYDMLNTPGWQEIAPGVWQNLTEGAAQHVYLGRAGAEYELSQLQADLAHLAAQSTPATDRRATYLKERIVAVQAALARPTAPGQLAPLNTWTECTANGQLAVTTAQAGVKAYGNGQCSSSRYVIAGNAYAYTSTSTGPYDSKSTFNTMNVASSAYGTSGCYSHVLVEFSDPYSSTDARVAVNKTSFRCDAL